MVVGCGLGDYSVLPARAFAGERPGCLGGGAGCDVFARCGYDHGRVKDLRGDRLHREALGGTADQEAASSSRTPTARRLSRPAPRRRRPEACPPCAAREEVLTCAGRKREPVRQQAFAIGGGLGVRSPLEVGHELDAA